MSKLFWRGLGMCSLKSGTVIVRPGEAFPEGTLDPETAKKLMAEGLVSDQPPSSEPAPSAPDDVDTDEDKDDDKDDNKVAIRWSGSPEDYEGTDLDTLNNTIAELCEEYDEAVPDVFETKEEAIAYLTRNHEDS